jgi:hypothetical protein
MKADNQELFKACRDAQSILRFAAEVSSMTLDRAMLIEGDTGKEELLNTASSVCYTLDGLHKLLDQAAERAEAAISAEQSRLIREANPAPQ